MSKKKQSKNALNVYYCGALLLGLIALIMIFVNNVNIVGAYSGEVHYAGSGLWAVFGHTTDNNISVFSFSVMNLITYLLVIAGMVLIGLKMGKVLKSKVVDLVAIGLFVVGGIFFFLVPAFAISSYANALGSLVSLKLGVGAIVAGVLSLVSAIGLIVNLVLNKK